MKRIGLLGGMSWESTVEYYRLINEAVAARLGGLHSARLLLSSLDFAEIEEMQVAGDWAAAARLLTSEARALEGAGAELIVLCTNTMHRVAEDIEKGTGVPFVHLADATADAVRGQGVTRVGLLGTAFTMEQDFYRGRLESHDLEVIVPGEADRAEVHRVIYDELCLGRILDESRDAYLEVVDRLVAAGAEGVVLGCTEIELLLDPDERGLTGVPLFPTSRIHARTAVDAALD